MLKFLGQVVLVSLTGAVLSGCQSIQTNPLTELKHIRQEQQSTINTVLVKCAGTEHCEFARINDVEIVQEHEQAKSINPIAVEKGYLELENQSPGQHEACLKIPPQLHEMMLRFYPVTRQHAEYFHIIHAFKANQKYTFKMYRQKNQTEGSLLAVSSPMPLCVDILQNSQLIRRFCRQYNTETGVSEFIEQKI